MAQSDGTATTRRSLNQTLALVFGAVYALVGLIGFFVHSSDGFAGNDGGKLLGIFGVNGLHNLVHILIGVVLLAASRRHRDARNANLTVGVVYLALAILGPFIDDTGADIVALNSADHVLHALSGLLLAGVALFGDKTVTDRGRTTTV
jgi:hypothetical protein